MAENKPAERKLIDYVKLSVTGYAMGVANVIPGVSGGTIAFISGIYEELINAIRQFASTETVKKLLCFKFKELYRELPWEFLAAIALGTLLAFATTAKLITWLLTYYESYTFAAFLGMIGASIFAVLKMVKKWSFGCIIAMAAGTVAAYLIVTLVPCETPNVWWLSFLCGTVVIVAMILPGVSGSFLLLIFGQYKYFWGAIGDLTSGKLSIQAFSTCFFLGIGAVFGLGVFSHFLNWLFKKWHDLTVSVLIGFMLGSIWKLWPWQQTIEYSVKIGKTIKNITVPPATAETIAQLRVDGAKITPLVQKNLLPQNFDMTFWCTVGLAVAGFAAVILLEYYANKKNTEGGVE
ncbi:MAG: DUF368 domain-containing protein [Victivallaceae bacterium]